MINLRKGWLIAAVMTACVDASAASAQAGTATNNGPLVQDAAAALAQDGAFLARMIGVDKQEAERRLLLQELSVAATDGLMVRWRSRLAGLSIEQRPDFHVSVLLVGAAPVSDEVLSFGGDLLPVRYHVGAVATHDQLVAALESRTKEIRSVMAHPVGLGLDARTGMLVAVASDADVEAEGVTSMEKRLTSVAGVPVRVRSIGLPASDMSGVVEVEGGGRVTGVNAIDGRRYACTTGFAVTNGLRDGVLTAAHCPDQLNYVNPDGGPEVPLPMAGQWGWGYQDVQVNVVAKGNAPLFYADSAKMQTRPVSGQRSRAGTRAGDVVCHRGERTGYSCAAVELISFSPAGDLCGGECAATWVTVAGPVCKGGDSGAPVFNGTVAFGIVKGGTYRADGSCAFYFYMSTDYLPDRWALINEPFIQPEAPERRGSDAKMSEKRN